MNNSAGTGVDGDTGKAALLLPWGHMPRNWESQSKIITLCLYFFKIYSPLPQTTKATKNRDHHKVLMFSVGCYKALGVSPQSLYGFPTVKN